MCINPLYITIYPPHHSSNEGRLRGKLRHGDKCTAGLLAVAVVLVTALALASPAFAQGDDPCEGGGYNPTPVAVAVTAVPIVVTSTTADYFVLYVKHDIDGTEVEIPVLVKLGEAGTTTLAENVEALPRERYRVEKYLVADPADVDGDCIDDITELADPSGKNPVNPAAAIALSDGTVAVPDQDKFETLAYYEAYIKFILFGLDTDQPGIYFVNTKTHDTHRDFLAAIGLQRSQDMITGSLDYHPDLVAPDGSRGLYFYRLLPYSSYYPFSLVARAYTVLAASMPLLSDNLAFNARNAILSSLSSDLPLYNESRVNLVFDIDIYADTGFLVLNSGEGYGLLRVMDPDERPHPRNIVIYEALPNELPRVAGIISTVPQTPLSHVNLRAVQDGIPNAYIRDALDTDAIDDLVGSYVHYTVTDDEYTIRAATRAEVDAHYASSRPAHEQTPERDLSVKTITPLSQIGFNDWKAFGVKAANVAVLGTLGFPMGTVPDGFAIPFYFYDEFLKAHDFYDDIEEMLADSDFQTDFEVQDDMLDDLRDDIKDAETPQWIIDALTAMHATYPAGQSLRYRSSTNNEDLPGFNGAGLYDSKTQHPDETEEDGIDKSLKQVFASLWTFRAFTEREFHRIDHLPAAMGVLVHPNYTDEKANGVAVSFDPTSGRYDHYYVNTQLGEDLVTNPDAYSVPEELLLKQFGGSPTILATSNQVGRGELLMSDAQLDQLRQHLTTIHNHFKTLYNPAAGDPFAMEIEFKITSANILAIKQARPWVFSGTSQSSPPPVRPPPPPPPPPVRPPPPPPPPPLAPDAPVVTRVLATSMVVNWEAPAESVVSSYDLRYREGSTGDFIDGPQDVIGTRTTILGLNPDTEYEIQVRASNSSGDGEWSELGTVQTSTPIPNDRFSLALDLDDSEGDQFISFVAVSSDGGSASIQIFGKSLKAISVNDLSVRFEYDAEQVMYEGFKRGPVLSGTSALGGKDFVNIGMTLRETRVESGLMGTLRFRAMDALSETEIRLVRVKLLQGGQSETIPMFLGVALQGSSLGLPISGPSPDFNGNGTVDIPDFLLFVDVFGLKAGQEGYEARYSLDGNDEIGIPDFLIFVDHFGKVVSQVPVFTSVLPVMRFVEENTASGQAIGDPISATGVDGEPLTYSLWGVDADYFTIDASTGQLETREAYNFETRNWYSPIVRVSDGKGRQVSVVVGIAIIDVAE